MHLQNQATCTGVPTRRPKSPTWGTAAPELPPGSPNTVSAEFSAKDTGGAANALLENGHGRGKPRVCGASPQPHGSLGPGLRARRSRFAPFLSHAMCSAGCAAPGRDSRRSAARTLPPFPRRTGSAAAPHRSQPLAKPGPAPPPLLPLARSTGKGPEPRWPPDPPGLPPHTTSPRLAGEGAGRRAAAGAYLY